MSTRARRARRASRARRGLSAAAAVTAAALLGACVEDLGLPPGAQYGDAYDVTPNGLVVVTTAVERSSNPPEYSAYVRRPGGDWQPLGTLPGASFAAATGVDDAGTVVGYSGPYDHTGFARGEAFLWDEAQGMRPLGAAPGNQATWATGISANGDHVIGIAEDHDYVSHPFVFHRRAGTTTYLPGRFVWLGDVNDAGVVVGTTESPDGTTRATVWEPPAYQPELLAPTDGDGPTAARAIDGDGTIVGTQGAVYGEIAGVRWSPGPDRTPTSLGAFFPEEVDDGNIVGSRQSDVRTMAAWWPAGADGPASLGAIGDRSSGATAIRGERMVGWVSVDPDGHRQPARFVPNP